MAELPRKLGFWDTDLGKAIKGGVLAAVAAGIASIVAALQGNPHLFGNAFGSFTPYAVPAVYAVLNFIAKRLDPHTPNVENVVR